MTTEFRKAKLPAEVRSLMDFDAKVFPEQDRFDRPDWLIYDSYWLLVNRRRIGCCAFERNADFAADGNIAPREGSLYIATTGILPKFQGRGFGSVFKAWQIAYARSCGFTRVVTNTRGRNTVMIDLNRKYGFRIERTIRGYYHDPTDATVVMSLALNGAMSIP